MIRIPQPLVMGLAVACVSSAVFSLITLNVLHDGSLVELDHTIALEMRQESANQSLFRPIMVAITYSGGVSAMVLMAVLGVIWQGWRGHGKMRVAIGWFLIVILGAVLNLTMKVIFERERPPLEWRDQVVFETNESFPSGHAMGGTIGIGLLGYALMLRDRHWRTKLAIILVLGAWIMSIGLSRVYLRAHWFSDVLGGFALGLAWLGFGLGLLETWRRREHDIRVEAHPRESIPT